jgi:hypothetical protein
MPKQTQVNFDCQPELKEKFDEAAKRAGFTTMAEAYRSFMREIVAKYPEPKGDSQSAMAG